MDMIKTVEFLCSNAIEDAPIVKKLTTHCSALVKRLELFTIVEDNIGKIPTVLPDITVVFLSANFTSNDNLMDKLEYYIKLNEGDKKALSIIPLYVSAIDKDTNPISNLTGYPSNKRGLNTFSSSEIDTILTVAVEKIKAILNK